MDSRIFKYEIYNSPTVQEIQLPRGFRLLDVDCKLNKFNIWCLVEPERPTVTARYFISATGQYISENAINTFKYIKTVRDNAYVWHVFFEE